MFHPWRSRDPTQSRSTRRFVFWDGAPKQVAFIYGHLATDAGPAGWTLLGGLGAIAGALTPHGALAGLVMRHNLSSSADVVVSPFRFEVPRTRTMQACRLHDYTPQHGLDAAAAVLQAR